MFCEKCGSKITNENAVFCMSCGARVNRPPVQAQMYSAPMPPVQNTADAVEPDTTDPEILKRRKMISVSGLVGMLMGIIGWFVLLLVLKFFIVFLPNEVFDIYMDEGIGSTICAIIALAATLLTNLLTVIYGIGLNNIDQLKGNSVRGYKQARAGMWVTVGWISFFLIILSVDLFS